MIYEDDFLVQMSYTGDEFYFLSFCMRVDFDKVVGRDQNDLSPNTRSLFLSVHVLSDCMGCATLLLYWIYLNI